jgi:hypothetical protein
MDHILVYSFGTDDDDPAYPDYVASLPGFEWGRMENCVQGQFQCAYENLGRHDPNALYVKVDDDILFIANGAIEHLVLDKLNAEAGTIVHGNGINHMHTPYFHNLIQKSRETDDHKIRPQVLNPILEYLSPRSGMDTSSYHDLKQECNANNTESRRSYSNDHFSFYGRDWQSAKIANHQHHQFLDHFLSCTCSNESSSSLCPINCLDVHPNDSYDRQSCHIKQQKFIESKLSNYKFHSFSMNDCLCNRPQPGYGYCSSSGFYRTSINLIAFEWMDVASHLDLISLSDEIALTVLIPERTKRQKQLLSGKAVYAHAAFTPQRLDSKDKFDECFILQRYKHLANLYLGTKVMNE